MSNNPNDTISNLFEDLFTEIEQLKHTTIGNADKTVFILTKISITSTNLSKEVHKHYLKNKELYAIHEGIEYTFLPTETQH